MRPQPSLITRRKVLLVCVSIVAMTLGFYWNSWGVADRTWFEQHQSRSEKFIVGRLVMSRQDGIFSAAGLLGLGDSAGGLGARSVSTVVLEPGEDRWTSSSNVHFQYAAYLDGRRFDRFAPYMSQTGGQGMILGALDRALPVAPVTRLKIYRALSSVLSATALTLMVLWFCTEFDIGVAVVVLLSTLVSQWLVVFGRSTYWSLWAFYLPSIGVMFYPWHRNGVGWRSSIELGTVVFLTLFLKCLINGFEYITTTVVMAMVPIVYYSIAKRDRTGRALYLLSSATLGAVVAILLSLAILIGQIATLTGSIESGIQYIAFSFGARTHGAIGDYPVSYAESLRAGVPKVLWTFLMGTAFDLNNYIETGSGFVAKHVLQLRFIYLIFIYAVASLVLLFRIKTKKNVAHVRRVSALLAVTWYSIAAPLSWHLLFKAHSADHPHLNHILWHMPFTLFGSATVGVVVWESWGVLKRKLVQIMVA